MLSRKILVSITRIAAIASLALVAGGCSSLQKAPAFRDAQDGVAYHLGTYNNIVSVTVQDSGSGKVLWELTRDISFAYGPTRFESFDYAKPPANMREVIPAQPLKAGDKIVIEVKYQYDSALSANMSSIRCEYEVTAVNKFKRVVGD